MDLEGTTVVEDEDKVVVEVGELEEDKEIVAGFKLSPRVRASTPVGRFCKRQG